jgi:hypothetical protein
MGLLANGLGAGEFYVSPAGDDANPGTEAKPWRTVQGAVNRLQPGDTLSLRGGVYREAVVVPRSGVAGKPIVIKAYRDERAVVSGCDLVGGWTRHEGRIWKASMPWTVGRGRNQVFCAGQVLVEARHPNTPAPGLEMRVAGLSPLWPTYGEFSIPKDTRVSQPGRVVSRLLDGQPDDYWKGAIYCGVHFEGWCAQTGVIEHSRSGEILVGDRTGGWWFGSAYGGRFPQEHEAGRGMIVGHLHALDTPGEWHWQDGTLYLMTRDDSPPQAIEAKRRALAFDLSGREHIRIEGLTIRGASLRLEDAADCTVDRCDLAYISHYAHHYGMGQIEKGRDTIRSGETGIFVGGHDNAFLNCSVRFSAGAGFHVRGYHHTIHNCLIDEVGYLGHYTNAITDAVSDYQDYENFLVGGHVITFNTLRNAGRHFFNYYGNGTSIASRDRGPMDYAATLVAHNHLYNGMLLTRDAGFITGYFCSGGSLNGQHSQLAYNVMHDCYDLSAIRWNKLGMVYLDEGTCQVDVHHNLFWAAPGALQRDMWFNTCCVDVREHDNLFHGLFGRTSAQLRDDDFPGVKPFRFGHDFDAPPTLPRWPQTVSQTFEASQCSSHSAGVKSTPAGLMGLGDGDWFAVDPGSSGSGWQTAVLRLASDAKQMNGNRTPRAVPRHQKATDPLVLEATHNDGAREKMRTQWTFFYKIEDGAWVRYDRVPLGEGYRRIRVAYGSDRPEPWQLEVRLDRMDGPCVGRVELTQTDRPRGSHVQIYHEALAELSPEARGTHDVFLVFRSTGGKPAVDFEYLRLEQYRGVLPLGKNDVQIEVRAGSKNGPKLGVIYPRFTGGADRFRDLVAPLDRATPRGPLFFVVRSALARPIGTVSQIRLEKGIQQAAVTDIGVPPRRDAQGRMVLPEPSHRPLPPQATGFESTGTRPFFTTPRLAASPVIDGQLTEWKGRPIELNQSLEGVVFESPGAQAWVGYDAQALYVAARVPRQARAPLLTAGHRWGATDGLEIALEDAEASPPGPILTLRAWPDGHHCVADVAGVSESDRSRLAGAVAYRAVQGNDAWTCEWRIPFSAARITPQPGMLLSCNISVRNTAANAWHSWNMGAGATYDLRNGGSLVLAGKDMTLPEKIRSRLAVWLDAADTASVERDAEGGVLRWKDKSRHQRDARQETARYRPRYLSDGLNGKATLAFDDARQTRLELPDLADRPITATIFAVVSNATRGLPKNNNQRIFTASNGREYDYLCGLACGIAGDQTGGPRTIVFHGQDRWAQRVRVGCFSPSYQTFFKGQIAEILVFDRTLTADERLRILAYLTAKWDL